MKFKTFFVAALAAMTLAACSKEKNTGPAIDDPTYEGNEATLKVSFTLPQGAYTPDDTRATEDATQAESAIKTVSVFVFKADGSLPASGHHFQLDDTDFDSGTAVGNATKYQMVSTPLRTTSGNKIIYVGVNLPAAFDVPVSNLAEFLAHVARVDNQLLSYSGSALDNLVMVASTETLIYDLESGIENNVDVEMERAMARIVTTFSGPDVNPTTGVVQVEFTSGVYVNYTLSNFFVVQDAYRSYLAPNFLADGTTPTTLINAYSFANRGQVVNLYDPDDYIASHGGTETIDYKSIVLDPGANSRASIDGFYIGENATNRYTQLAQYGNTTYAYIQTEVNMGSTAEFLGGSITYTTNNPIVAGTDDLYVLNVKSNASVTNNASLMGTYLCHEDTIDDITDFLQSEGYDKDDDLDIYIYWEAYVYFPVFLNATSKTGLDKYNVYRNEFINIDIQGINASKDDGFGGYPGDEDDPKVPIDPGTEDPNNPKPWEPEEPIDENPADLNVNIVVNPWEYVGNPTILSK